MGITCIKDPINLSPNSPDALRGMNTFILKTSDPRRRVSVWADRRFLLPDTTIEPGRIFFFAGNVSGLAVGPDVGGVLRRSDGQTAVSVLGA